MAFFELTSGDEWPQVSLIQMLPSPIQHRRQFPGLEGTNRADLEDQLIHLASRDTLSELLAPCSKFAGQFVEQSVPSIGISFRAVRWAAELSDSTAELSDWAAELSGWAADSELSDETAEAFESVLP